MRTMIELLRARPLIGSGATIIDGGAAGTVVTISQRQAPRSQESRDRLRSVLPTLAAQVRLGLGRPDTCTVSVKNEGGQSAFVLSKLTNIASLGRMMYDGKVVLPWFLQ